MRYRILIEYPDGCYFVQRKRWLWWSDLVVQREGFIIPVVNRRLFRTLETARHAIERDKVEGRRAWVFPKVVETR